MTLKRYDPKFPYNMEESLDGDYIKYSDIFDIPLKEAKKRLSNSLCCYDMQSAVHILNDLGVAVGWNAILAYVVSQLEKRE